MIPLRGTVIHHGASVRGGLEGGDPSRLDANYPPNSLLAGGPLAGRGGGSLEGWFREGRWGGGSRI